MDNVSIEFGDQPLLHSADLSIEPNERICLIGRNGAGKTTLLKIIAGDIEPDSGEVHRQQLLRISQLQQTLPDAIEKTVFEIVRSGLRDQVERIERYTLLSAQVENGSSQQLQGDNGVHSSSQLQQLEQLQQAIELGGGWNIDKQVERTITQLKLPADKLLSELSGGWRRRVALAKALVSQPTLLLLDEPSNHLDLATIEWLEHTVRGYSGTVVFITHDRHFLQNLATRIVEIDRGKLLSWPVNYNKYLVLKEKANQDEDTRNALFDKRLSEEENWIRQGIKARRTRNEGRVRALEAMRKEYAARSKRQAKAQVQIESAEQSGRKVCELRSVTHSFANKKLIDNLKLKIQRGDRIGLVGNNGVGKTTLLKIMLAQLIPDSGSVKLGTNLDIAYYDQVARDLDEDKSIAENVGDGSDYIHLDGKARHVIGYLRNFLFSPQRAQTPVRALSGGEKNRVSLAKLFSRPSNLLVLDEPTNDLDLEMLEVLEEQLVNYGGTLLIVSHDRRFLDNVVTSVLVFEEMDGVQHYPGGYSDWSARGKKLAVAEQSVFTNANADGAANQTETQEYPSEPAQGESSTANSPPTSRKKLSYKLQRELDNLPETIELLEKELAELHAIMEHEDFYQRDYEETQPILDSASERQKQLEELMSRWLELEEMTSNS